MSFFLCAVENRQYCTIHDFLYPALPFISVSIIFSSSETGMVPFGTLSCLFLSRLGVGIP